MPHPNRVFLPVARVFPPFRLWPQSLHVVLSCACIAASVAACAWGVRFSSAQVVDASRALEAVKARLRAGSSAPASLPRTDFRQALPPAARVDVVVQQASGLAQARGVQITSLSVQRQVAATGDIGQSTLVFNLIGAYPQFKAWLADMQERNDSLAVEALSLHRSGDTQQEVQLTLALFTRD